MRRSRSHDAVKTTGKVFQSGSPGCATEGSHKAAEIIQSGKLGKLVWARRGTPAAIIPNGEWNYTQNAAR